jgi:hypothetical protein
LLGTNGTAQLREPDLNLIVVPEKGDRRDMSRTDVREEKEEEKITVTYTQSLGVWTGDMENKGL